MIEKKINFDTEYLVKEVPLLYNYMSDSGALKFSDNHQIMVSKPTRFNDPYDCLPDLIKFESFPKEYEEHPNYNKTELEKFLREQSFPKIVDKTGVSCFSETGTNMLMWSHYSNSHKGICIAYDLKEFYFNLKKVNSINCDTTLIKIGYTKEFTPIDLFSDYKTALYNWLSTKSSCWSYEKEVRVTFRDFPFEEGENFKLININKKSIKKIFLGSKMDTKNEKEIINKLKAMNSDIEFYKMERKPNSFDLVPKKIIV